MMSMWNTFTDAFYLNFVSENRWKYLTDGLKTTLIITLFACLMGIVLGFIVGMIRSTYEKTHKLKLLNAICKVYLTVIRGTPVIVQLLIIYFVLFGSVRIDKVLVAILAFGINSGAYVAEIFRSGIMSIDGGQMDIGSEGPVGAAGGHGKTPPLGEEAVQGLQIPPGHLTVAVIQRVVKITDQQDTVEFSQRKNLNSVSSAASAAERGRTERSPERSG